MRWEYKTIALGMALGLLALALWLSSSAQGAEQRWTRQHVEQEICRVFHPCAYPIRIAYCESNPSHLRLWPRWATGAAGERGPFQIHPVWFKMFDRRKLYGLRYNILAAFRISGRGTNFGPWSCA